MSILRTDKIAGLDSVSAITGSVFFGNGVAATAYDSLVTDASSDYTMGTGDFNLEGWFYLNTVTTTWQILISDTLYGDTGGWSFYANGAQLNFWKGGASVVSGGTLTANTWHHIAFSREGGTNRIFVDGVVAGTATDSTDYTDNRISVGANNVDKGGVLGSYGLSGYASNVRVCKGHAVYDKAFTPPTRELLQHYTSPGNESVLLCCQSSQDAGQDATGRTLSVRGNARPTTFVPDVGNDHTHGTVLEGGTAFSSLNYMTLPRGTATQSNRGRGVFMANAVSPTMSNAISYIDIQSSGNTVDFGDLTVTLRYGAGGSSATRGLSGGGVTPSWPANNVIDYFTLATTANAQNFGDMIKSGSYGHACLANSTRLLWCGGYSAPDSNNTNTVSYSTIATLGDALDFGDLSDGSSYLRRYLGGGIQSPTRGILVGGYSGGSYTNSMVYISITTLGNSADFGDISYTASGTPGASSSTRGVIFPGYNGTNYNTNSIEYVTIASTGNAVDFGDTAHSGGYGQAVSNSSRAVMGHGITPSPGTNYMEFVTIATTGNASDFGDMGVHTGDSGNNNNCSDSHGGLS